MTLDSHQHFWNYSEAEYPWISESLAPLKRDFLPADLAPHLARAGIDGTIAVQARQSAAESEFLLKLADASPLVRGVVGWVDVRADTVDRELESFAAHPKAVGVRHVVQDEPDDDFMLRPEFIRGISRLKPFGLTYDILIFPKQLRAAIELVRRFPEQPFVLDHIAKPFIRDGTLSPWREQIRELAQSPNVMCKVSGMVTEANWIQWQQDDFRPYLDVVFEAFGAGRLMFGSDWPVCLVAGSYEQVHGIVDTYTHTLDEHDRAAIFGGNAARFYGIV